jgi:hypothetical protein
MTGDVVIEGRAAWDRLKGRKRASWEDWVKVGHALVIGRTEALKTANTNRAVGSKYNRAMGQWLREVGLDLTAQERHSLMRIMANLDAIEQWRGALPAELRRKHNSPSLFWIWRKATREAPRRERAAGATPPKKTYGAAVHWPQDFIRRAAMAMRESGSRDLFVLARAALERAIRDDGDVAELLASTPRRPTPVAAAAFAGA